VGEEKNMQSIDMVWYSYLGSFSRYEYKNGPFFWLKIC